MDKRKVRELIKALGVVDEPELTAQEQRIAELKAGSDPLGLHSVLLRMAERGWISVEHVNGLKFGPDDAPSLPYLEEAVAILTAMRDKLRVKRAT